MKTKKAFGFYVSLALVALCVIAAGVYYFNYGNTAFISWPSLYVMFIGAGVSLLASLFMGKLAPALILATSTIGTCLMVYAMYFFISSIAYGIQFSSVPVQLIVVMGAYIVTMLASLINIFLPQVKKN